MSDGLKAISLFAGVGGMDLACEAAGIDVIATAEIDKHAHALLKRKWPTTHHYTDVKDVTRDGLLRDVGTLPDLVIGGFPCQDLSVAGLQAGLAGERSGLFWEHLRIAKECGSKWVVFENVPGLMSNAGGRDMGTVLGALAACGYGFAYRVLDAQYFGVPQRRRRVFIVGCLGDDGSAPSEVLALAEGSLGHPAPSRPTRQDVAGAAELGAGDVGEPAKCLTTRQERYDYETQDFVVTEDGARRGPVVTYRKSRRAQSNQDDETWVEDEKTNTLNLFDTSGTRTTSLIVEPPAFMWQAGGNNSASGAYEYGMTPTLPKSQTIAVQTEASVRRLTPLECERLQGFPDDWTAGQADSHRYRQMGNAVAVPCVAWFLKRLVAVAGIRLPRHDAVVHELLEGVPQVGAEVAVALLPSDAASCAPEVIGDADVA